MTRSLEVCAAPYHSSIRWLFGDRRWSILVQLVSRFVDYHFCQLSWTFYSQLELLFFVGLVIKVDIRHRHFALEITFSLHNCLTFCIVWFDRSGESWIRIVDCLRNVRYQFAHCISWVMRQPHKPIYSAQNFLIEPISLDSDIWDFHHL